DHNPENEADAIRCPGSAGEAYSSHDDRPRRTSRLHGPAPAAAKESHVKQKNTAGSPRLTPASRQECGPRSPAIRRARTNARPRTDALPTQQNPDGIRGWLVAFPSIAGYSMNPVNYLTRLIRLLAARRSTAGRVRFPQRG